MLITDSGTPNCGPVCVATSPAAAPRPISVQSPRPISAAPAAPHSVALFGTHEMSVRRRRRGGRRARRSSAGCAPRRAQAPLAWTGPARAKRPSPDRTGGGGGWGGSSAAEEGRRARARIVRPDSTTDGQTHKASTTYLTNTRARVGRPTGRPHADPNGGRRCTDGQSRHPRRRIRVYAATASAA